MWLKHPASVVIDFATYLLMISLPDIDNVAMSLYDIVLRYPDETLQLITTLEEDWARIDTFGAKMSASHLLLLVANYYRKQFLRFYTSCIHYAKRLITCIQKSVNSESFQNSCVRSDMVPQC